jgi:hypothetical protein
MVFAVVPKAVVSRVSKLQEMPHASLRTAQDERMPSKVTTPPANETPVLTPPFVPKPPLDDLGGLRLLI